MSKNKKLFNDIKTPSIKAEDFPLFQYVFSTNLHDSFTIFFFRALIAYNAIINYLKFKKHIFIPDKLQFKLSLMSSLNVKRSLQYLEIRST